MLSGLILAGGRSSRMGRDKAALVLPDGTHRFRFVGASAPDGCGSVPTVDPGSA